MAEALSQMMKRRIKQSNDQLRLHQSVIVLVALLCYWNSLGCGFVFDDISAIRDNKDLRPHTPLTNLLRNDFWGTPMHKEQSHKSYRPLCVLTFRWNYAVHALEPFGYHLVNVLLHVIVCLLYLRLCTIFLAPTPSFVASLVFAVHPVHTEAVTGVVGRAETLSSVFFIAAFLTYVSSTGRNTNWAKMFVSLFFAVGAVLSKEQGVTVLGVCCVYELFIIQKLKLEDVVITLNQLIQGKPGAIGWLRQTLTRSIFIVISTIILLLFRVKIMGSQLPVFTKFDNPASAESTPYRHLTYNYLLAVNSWLLLFPSNLCCDWTMGTIPIISSLLDLRNLSTVLFYVVFLKLVHSTGIFQYSSSPCSGTDTKQVSPSHENIVIMSLALMVLPFLPASNLFFPVGFVVAERVLYIPSMGFCLLVGHGWSLLNQKSLKKYASAGIVFLFISHSCKTVLRNYDWESELSIFKSGIAVNANNAKLYNNVGHALESSENYTNALEFFLKAVSVQPDDIGAHINVGRTYNHLKMYEEAEQAYRKAKNLLPRPKPKEAYQTRIAPNHLNVFLNLANLISRNDSRLEEADVLYRQAISMRADYTQAYINRGDILIKMNRTKEAQEVYEKALQYDNNNADIYYNLGVVFLEQGKALQALAYLDKALEFDPEHQQALMNSAVLIQETGNPSLQDIAYKRLLRLLEKDQMNERAYFNLGMLGMDRKDYVNAEKWFKMSIQLKEDFRSALFNLALLLSDTNRPLEAAPYLQQLLKFHPDHIKGLILLGDIYINNIKDLNKAEECYNRIMSLDANNVQGLHNLCVVYIEQGRLVKAEQCMAKAASMAPNEEYIQRHLKILRARMSSKRLKNANRNSDNKDTKRPS